MADDEDAGPKPNKANIDDEFLRHPHSGAFIRNPLLDKSRSSPILFQEPEFRHNCLEEALADYNCLTVSEKSFKEMMRMGAQLIQKEGEAGATAPASPLARAALSTLTKSTQGYEFVVSVKKSTYVPPRNARRRQEAKPTIGTMVDKLNIEVNDDKEGGLKVEDIKEGLIAAWNRRQHSAFQVRPGDRVLKANNINFASATPQQLMEEMEQCPDALRLTVRRPAVDRRASKQSLGSQLAVP
mmetsp:Transcript_115299/g.330949  ORF Transcript_115299/g.330949 Transcript_115299/m.330949 type:complete len:241 (-) Transcript_115299:8-730(-)|eukprot:CAMPEP_0170296016 /NCGR_PEP_ID=MMETSP0116_2-20130129/48139_1 /TAXON_ID=400756 /ORGANISM="Durinskia baltica, Strain CSIRO CS-38" /LENGTH=240 /DNA_ID=CAMNT_0010547581 /DNA_START=86 /DNA_END=808 /DNA_ORIENTATION=+